MALNLPAAVQPGGAAMLPPQASRANDNQVQDLNVRRSALSFRYQEKLSFHRPTTARLNTCCIGVLHLDSSLDLNFRDCEY